MTIQKIAANLLCVSTILFSSNAFAADIVKYKPHFKPYIINPVVAPFDWAGAYAGVAVGLTNMKIRETDGSMVKHEDNLYTLKSAAYGNIYAGYNVIVVPRIVLGAELGIGKGKLDKINKLAFPAEGSLGQDYIRLNELYSGYANVRVGYEAENFLPYVTGGYAFSSTKFIEDDDKEHLGADMKSHFNNGWNIGAGIEYAVTPSIILRTEYKHRVILDSTFARYNQDNKAYDYFTYETKTHSDSISIGVSYKF